MSGTSDILSDAPIPEVDARDLRRVFSLMSLEPAACASGSHGVSVRLFAEECSAGSDVLATCMRAFLITILSRQGTLDDYRDELPEVVFVSAAMTPLARGLNSFDSDDFSNRLANHQ